MPLDSTLTRLLLPTLGAPTSARVGSEVSREGSERSDLAISLSASTCLRGGGGPGLRRLRQHRKMFSVASPVAVVTF